MVCCESLQELTEISSKGLFNSFSIARFRLFVFDEDSQSYSFYKSGKKYSFRIPSGIFGETLRSEEYNFVENPVNHPDYNGKQNILMLANIDLETTLPMISNALVEVDGEFICGYQLTRARYIDGISNEKYEPSLSHRERQFLGFFNHQLKCAIIKLNKNRVLD